MRIDNCGSNSDKLKEIYNGMVKHKEENKEEMTMKSADDLDAELFQAYQTILSIANDGNAVALALYNLSKRVEKGDVDVSELSSTAIDVAMQAAVAENVLVIPEELKDNIADQLAVLVLVGGPLNEEEKRVATFLCDEETEKAYKPVYENAIAGDKKSQKVIDLMNKAENFIVKQKSLNPKGAVSGALVLAYELNSTGDKAALITAKKLIEAFGLQEVMENGAINPDKVKEVFARKHPNMDLDELNRKNDQHIEQRGKEIVEQTPQLHKDAVLKKIERKRMMNLSAKLSEAIKNGDVDEITRLVKENEELSKKLYEFTRTLYEKCKNGKQPSQKGLDLLLSKATAIGMVLGKSQKDLSNEVENDTER